MSQHDFSIANQGFPSFRADLNSGLEALATNSSGATAPSTTYAYQFWYDTANDLLKMRNGGNDAWITLAAFDQTNDEWEVRSAVIQAVDSAGVSIKTDEGTTRFSVSDSGQVSFQNYSFPTADGTANQALVTDGSGNLSFATLGGNEISENNSSVEVIDSGIGRIEFTTDGSQVGEFDGSGNFKFNSGYGSVATAYGCRAWVNFDGTGTVSIRESGNVSSITDVSTARYTVNFTTAMPDNNYSALGTGNMDNGLSASARFAVTDTTSYGTASFQIKMVNSDASFRDASRVNLVIFR